MKQPISVIILTLNEEANLEQCLKSVADLATEVIVVDSGSTDRTSVIAKNYGAKFVEHKDYKNQAQQFNWALGSLEMKGDWILKLDADEYLTPELAEEIKNVIGSAPAVNGYYMKRRVYFMGRWMKHGGYYPIWFLRLWRKGKATMENKEMDEHAVLLDGRTANLEYDFVDDNNKGLSDWIAKHNDYSSREARDVISGHNFGEKRNFYYRLPPFLRAFLFFGYRYFLRLGFFDGKEGLMFHLLQCFWYRFLIDAKIYEQKRSKIHESSTGN